MNNQQKAFIRKFKTIDPAAKVQWDHKRDAPALVIGRLSEQVAGISAKNLEQAAREFLDEHRTLFGVSDTRRDLSLIAQNQDQLGNTSVAMQQLHHGIPIHGATTRVQFGTDRSINRIASKFQQVMDVDTTPSIDADAAGKKALADADAGTVDTAKPPQLRIIMVQESWHLAWVLRIVGVKGNLPFITLYCINAKNGDILEKYNDLQTFPDVTGHGTGFYTGSGPINTFQEGTTYRLIDNTRVASGGPSIRVCNCDGGYANPSDAIISQDSNNNWNNSSTTHRKDHQGPEVDALRYIGQVVDYFRSTHSWNSFDNAGKTVYVAVHYGSNYNNGFWNGVGIFLGDGDGILLNYTTTNDFIAHEFTHAVTEHTAHLDYRNQAGGLNESFSDIFAIMVDRDDFDIFEDCTTPSIAGDAARTMNDPSSGRIPEAWRQPNHTVRALDSMNTGYFDEQDPHYASGFVNFAAYLLIHGGTHPNSGISVNPIGHEKAEKIFFHALSIGLLGNNDASFVECREACLNAVNMLYRLDTDYLKILDSVKNAFTAVGIGPDIYVRDSLSDTGVTPSIGTLCHSPDVITRNFLVATPETEFADMGNGDLCEPVEIGQPNYIYVRLQNRGAEAGDITINIYWAYPGSYANTGSWHLIGTTQVNGVPPGSMRVAGPIIWAEDNLPPEGHFCLVTELDDPLDPAPDKSLITTGDQYIHYISQSNNYAWRNVEVHDAIPGGAMTFKFMLRGTRIAERGDLLIDLESLAAGSQPLLRIAERLCKDTEMIGLRFEKSNFLYNYFILTPGRINYLNRIPFKANDSSEVHLYITLAEESSGTCALQAIQRFNGAAVSRQNFVINLLPVASFEYIGNTRSREVHKKNCVWIGKMNKSNMTGFHTLEHAHLMGHDNCAFCIGGSKR
jgi:Zinc metalloprotease (elastase)